MLKMDSKYTVKEKRQRVHEVLEEVKFAFGKYSFFYASLKFSYKLQFKLSLLKCKDTKIGSQDSQKGISGGEKRRLSFASEVD